ncbi:MAG TPA: ATP-binding protein [Acidimicrobiales bacterium]
MSSSAQQLDGSHPARRVADLLPIGVVVADLEGSAIFANHAWTAMAGHAGDGWRGAGWLGVLDAGDRDQARRALLAAISSGAAHESDWVVTDSTQEARVFHVTAVPDFGDGGPVGLVAAIRDVTEERRARDGLAPTPPQPPPGAAGRLQTAATNDALDLLAAAAHELRTPLSAIAGYAATLRENREIMSSEDIDRSFMALERQTGRLTTLLDNLLDLGRWRHGAGAEDGPGSAPVRVADAFGDALEAAPPPDGVIVTVARSSPSLHVRAGRSGLTQVLVNLLTNAYRYGGPHITLDSHEEASTVVLDVVDDGAGVPLDLQPKMFLPFCGGGNGSRPRPGAAGLGLALATRIVEFSGGRLSYQAAQPHGAHLIVTLPRAEDDPR